MDVIATYKNTERPTEITKTIEEMNEDEFKVFVNTILDDNDFEKQKAFAKHLVTDKFWKSKTQQFIRYVSVGKSDLAYFIGQHLWNDTRNKLNEEYKEFAPGLYACFYQRMKLKPPIQSVLIPEFFFGQLLIRPEENPIVDIFVMPKFKSRLKQLIQENYEDITELAKQKWISRYGEKLLFENEDSIEEETDSVTHNDYIEEDNANTNTINTHPENYEDKNSDVLRFLLASLDKKIDFINNQDCLSTADELLSNWINSSRDRNSLMEIVNSLVVIHQAFGLESQNALLVRASSLCFKRKLDVNDFSEILIKFNLVERYFDQYFYLQSDSEIFGGIIDHLLLQGENEHVINGLLILSNNNYHTEMSLVATHYLVALIEDKQHLAKAITHKLKGHDYRNLIGEMIKRLAETASYNRDLTLQLSERSRAIESQRIYTLHELGESLKDIIRTMETKAADIISSGDNGNYIIHFVQTLRKHLSRSGLLPVEKLHNLGATVEIEKGIHVINGSGVAPYVLKSLGLRCKGPDQSEFIIDNPRVESLNIMIGEVNQDA